MDHLSRRTKSRPSRQTVLGFGLVLATGISAAACQRDAPNPELSIFAPAAQISPSVPVRGFMPLEIGNRWTYRGEIAFDITSSGVRFSDPFVIQEEEERTIIGTEEINNREYVLEKQVIRQSSRDDTITHWVRHRQDRAGLYAADVSVLQPPTSAPSQTNDALPQALRKPVRQFIKTSVHASHHAAYELALEELLEKRRIVQSIIRPSASSSQRSKGPPGGVLPDEITRLRYPVHPGQQWIVRDRPFFASVVEAPEVLDLPPGKMNGFRIETTNELLGPDDRVLFWFGRDGFLGQHIYLESVATDENGNPIGVIKHEEYLFLESLDLVRPGR